jgi:hypothetical protein
MINHRLHTHKPLFFQHGERKLNYVYLLLLLLLLLLGLFLFLLLLFRFLLRFLSNFFSMISCGSTSTLTREIIPRASSGFVVRGPMWLTLSRRFSHVVKRREMTVPRVSKPLIRRTFVYRFYNLAIIYSTLIKI